MVSDLAPEPVSVLLMYCVAIGSMSLEFVRSDFSGIARKI